MSNSSIAKNAKSRQSNFELLRILCIFGIVYMHTFGMFYSSATGINLIHGVFINSLFNTGVSLFMMISGYFGIKFTSKKYLKLEIETLSYSILSFLVGFFFEQQRGTKDIIKNLLKAFLPVTSNQYWYMTSYIFLMIFSSFINAIPEKLTKADFQKLIFLIFLVFSLIPTIFQFHILNDGGKGIANMLLIYLIGRYIRIYWNTKSGNQYWHYSILFILIGFILNTGSTFLRGNSGLYAPFARDCSIIIIFASISIFMAFKQLRFESSFVNTVSKHVIAIYLFEGAIRTIINYFFDISIYSEKWYLFIIITIYVLAVMSVCIITNIIAQIIINPLEHFAEFICNKLYIQSNF